MGEGESREEGDEEGEMKIKTAAAIVLLGCAAISVGAADKPEPIVLISQGWVTGQYFLSLNEGQKSGMAAGIISGLFMSPLMGGSERGDEIVALHECTHGMSIGQLSGVLEKYVRDHPERWNYPIAVLAVQSMRSVCPGFSAATSAISRRGVVWGEPNGKAQ